MFFFLLHNLIHYAIKWSPETSEGRKNTFTIFGGSMLYVMFFVFLEWYTKIYNSLLSTILRNFYLYLVGADLLTMIAVYKLYWGRNIFNEISDTDNWSYNQQIHKYTRKSPPIDIDPIGKIEEASSLSCTKQEPESFSKPNRNDDQYSKQHSVSTDKDAVN